MLGSSLCLESLENLGGRTDSDRNFDVLRCAHPAINCYRQ
jgi:hypothetical protein